MPTALPKKGLHRLGGRSRSRVGTAKRVDWMLRELRCIATPGTERETLERLVQEEVERMGRLVMGAEAIAKFLAAAAIHIDACGEL